MLTFNAGLFVVSDSMYMLRTAGAFGSPRYPLIKACASCRSTSRYTRRPTDWRLDWAVGRGSACSDGVLAAVATEMAVNDKRAISSLSMAG